MMARDVVDLQFTVGDKARFDEFHDMLLKGSGLAALVIAEPCPIVMSCVLPRGDLLTDGTA
ncbi:hypothetical protein [Bradyrhizobium sp. USDA 223]|uniref:hypothetical protein n=1 Tax=Bradyrhizobium sp. USDA 223 TaxID=3156306 RepID=UPI003833F9FB